MGRPTAFSAELADAICEKLADGQSLRSICLDDDMPHQSTIFRWLAAPEHESFCEQYARAREAQADALFDEMLDIADAEGMHEPVDVQQAKLRVETRKWMAGKLKPKVYGERATLDMNHAMSQEMAEWLGQAAS